jgi:hypothetical protein
MMPLNSYTLGEAPPLTRGDILKQLLTYVGVKQTAEEVEEVNAAYAGVCKVEANAKVFLAIKELMELYYKVRMMRSFLSSYLHIFFFFLFFKIIFTSLNLTSPHFIFLQFSSLCSEKLPTIYFIYNPFDSIRFDSIRFDSIRFDSILEI